MYSRSKERQLREDPFVHELCWWMKHATGQKDYSSFISEATAHFATPNNLQQIEPVLDVLAENDYKMSLSEARLIYNVSVRAVEPPKELPEYCYLADCASAPSVWDSHRLYAYYGDAELRPIFKNVSFADGIWLCSQHATSYLFPIVDMLHKNTEADILQDFDGDDMFPGGRPRGKSLLTKIRERDTV